MALIVKYFDDFKLNQTILVSVDKPALQLLLQTVIDLANSNDKKIYLSHLPYVRTYNHSELTFYVTSNDHGLSKTAGGFTLNLPNEGWDYVKALLNELLDSKVGQGHQYIEYRAFCNRTMDIDVVISVNEYPDEWIGWKE
jgi:hypothetical protein